MSPNFSIIIPTFNRASSLQRAIKSVQAQTTENWELIIVDDGSVDETKTEIQKFLKDPRIKYFFQSNQGVSVARNNGVKNASGEYIIFLDSDDTIFPNLLNSLLTVGYKEYDLICWEVLKVIDGKESLWKPEKLSKIYNGLKVSFLSGSICYRKCLFLKMGGYDPLMSFGENYELGLRISQIDDLRIKIIDKVFLKYEICSKTRISNSLENRLQSYLHQYYKHRELYKKNPKENSEMNYLIGFVQEKLNNKQIALGYYKNSWIKNPLRIKALIKIVYLKLT